MEISKEVENKIKDGSLNYLRNTNAERNVNLFLYNNVLNTGEKLKTFEKPFDQEINIPVNTAFVLADLAPQYNWAHPCQWWLHYADTGELYARINASLPPIHFIQHSERSKLFHAPVKLIDTKVRRNNWETPIKFRSNILSNHKGERYAILFSGGSNNRHVNDIEFLYRTLIDKYGFNPANIYVLNHDGTINYNGEPQPVKNWPGDKTPYKMKVTGQGSRAAFQKTIATLTTKIQSDDLLFIHTNDHGAGPGDGVNDYCLVTYDPNGWIPYYAQDFVLDLKILPPFAELMVMMEQCRSGGFILPLTSHSPASKTHVATAVQASDRSLGGDDFDPFAEDWIAGVAGHYPNGDGLAQPVDTNHDGLISATEAFTYANAVHHAGDTPTSSETPHGAGDSFFLG